MFQSLHSPSGFHEGHGSGVSFSPLGEGQDSLVSRRLACPSSLLGSGPSGSELCPPFMSSVGHCDRQGQVKPRLFPTDCLSRPGLGICVFQSFSNLAESKFVCQLVKNCCPLPCSQCLFCGFTSGFCHLWLLLSRGPPLHAVSPAPSQSLVGLGGRLLPGPVRRLFMSGSSLVAGLVLSGGGSVPVSGVPRPQLLVQFFRCGWGAHLAEEVASCL